MHRVLDEVPVWEPVDAAALPEPPKPLGAGDREEVVARAAALGLLQVRWPPRVPTTPAREAMVVADWSRGLGKVVSYSLAAFRQAFNAGADLTDRDTVLTAAAGCEIHPRAVVKALEQDRTARSLDEATAAAVARGVRSVPALTIGATVVAGPRAVEDAARLLGHGDA
ncbi:MAG: DsbA family protein [Solirubrobacterales bacterium]